MTATTDHKVMNNRLDRIISARVMRPNTEEADEMPEVAHIVRATMNGEAIEATAVAKDPLNAAKKMAKTLPIQL